MVNGREGRKDKKKVGKKDRFVIDARGGGNEKSAVRGSLVWRVEADGRGWRLIKREQPDSLLAQRAESEAYKHSLYYL